tara:strand:- start:4903 stop:7212 length:2310 start_codon:yes stop_codon:yes gene_type:complete
MLYSTNLKKSDGNVIAWDGQYHAQRHPPEESFNSPDPNFPEIHAPPFAHTGGHGEKDTGMPGVGNLIKGRFDLEKTDSGKIIPVWKDDFGGSHYHGVDGVAHHYGNLLKKSGVGGCPIEDIEEAIKRTNAEHANGENHLPNFYDPAWRKIALSDYQGNNEEGARQHYIQHGGEKKLVTGYTNYHKQRSPFGTFIDSLSVPFQKHLRNIAIEKGIDPQRIGGKSSHFLKYPHIKRNLLSYAVHPEEGHNVLSGNVFPSGHFQGGKGHAANEEMVTGLSNLGHSVDRSIEGLSAHSGAAHKLPDDFYKLKTRKGGSTDGGAYSIVMNEILSAIGESTEGRVGQRLSEGKPNMNPLQHPALTNTMFKGVHLGHWLSQPQLREALLQELQGTSAFNKLNGATKKHSAHQKLMNAYTELHTGVPTEEELENTMDFDSYRSTIGTMNGRRGTHHTAGNIYALAMLAGKNEEVGNMVGNTKLRSSELTPELAAKHGISLRQEAPEVTAERRRVMEALHDYLGEAQGHNVRVPLPEALPTQATSTHSVTGGRYQGGTLADYIPYQATYNSPALGDTESRTMGNTIQTDKNPILSQQAVMQPQPPQTQQRQGPQTQQRQGPTPLPPNVAATRMASAQLSDEALQRVSAAGGQRLSTPENIARYRQSFTDPQQTFLSQFSKGGNNMTSAQDRIVKALEDVQMKDALSDDSVLKHLTNSKLSIESSEDIATISKKLGLAPQDVRLIHNAKGDWMRLTKSFGYTETTIKVVKASFRSGLNE